MMEDIEKSVLLLLKKRIETMMEQLLALSKSVGEDGNIDLYGLQTICDSGKKDFEAIVGSLNRLRIVAYKYKI
jgi:hypothetical protein